jgi:hypothetical protein
MNFTQQQVSEILDQIASGQNGYQQIRSNRHFGGCFSGVPL